MSIVSITKRARAGTLEVEHLLRAAAFPDPALADALDALSAELGWLSSGIAATGNPEAPLAGWVRVVSMYCREGCSGLVRGAADVGLSAFVIGLLEELKTKDALDALCLAFERQIDEPSRDGATSLRIASALNLMLSFKPACVPATVQAARLRAFLHALYPCAESDAQRATVLLALRGLGDEDSARFAASQRLPSPWLDVSGIVAKHIRKRLRASAGPTGAAPL